MKKILILLGVMTISGTTIATTIATSPYQKQENKLKISATHSSQINKNDFNKYYFYHDHPKFGRYRDSFF